MPKSKIRSKHTPTHYNPYAGIITPEQRKAKFGARGRPIPGTTHRITKQSAYMGSRITPENRNEYEKQQAEAFKERYIANIDRDRDEIRKKDDKTPEEIESEINKFNSEQITEAELDFLAKKFARFQSIKENKHYQAWLSGKSYFKYGGRTLPVLTESFLKRSKSIKDIIKVEDNGAVDGQGDATGEINSGLHINNEGRDDETVRSDTDTNKDTAV